MGWFDEQISKRVLSDQETMEDSLLHIASAVLGTYQTGTHSGNRSGTADAINDILMYYKLKPCTIPVYRISKSGWSFASALTG